MFACNNIIQKDAVALSRGGFYFNYAHNQRVEKI